MEARSRCQNHNIEISRNLIDPIELLKRIVEISREKTSHSSCFLDHRQAHTAQPDSLLGSIVPLNIPLNLRARRNGGQVWRSRTACALMGVNFAESSAPGESGC
jgi:hypothetical protein